MVCVFIRIIFESAFLPAFPECVETKRNDLISSRAKCFFFRHHILFTTHIAPTYSIFDTRIVWRLQSKIMFKFFKFPLVHISEMRTLNTHIGCARCNSCSYLNPSRHKPDTHTPKLVKLVRIPPRRRTKQKYCTVWTLSSL